MRKERGCSRGLDRSSEIKSRKSKSGMNVREEKKIILSMILVELESFPKRIRDRLCHRLPRATGNHVTAALGLSKARAPVLPAICRSSGGVGTVSPGQLSWCSQGRSGCSRTDLPSPKMPKLPGRHPVSPPASSPASSHPAQLPGSSKHHFGNIAILPERVQDRFSRVNGQTNISGIFFSLFCSAALADF